MRAVWRPVSRELLSSDRPRATAGARPSPGIFGFSRGADRDRTGDLLTASQALSQLSYGPKGAQKLARSAAKRETFFTEISSGGRAPAGHCRVGPLPLRRSRSAPGENHNRSQQKQRGAEHRAARGGSGPRPGPRSLRAARGPRAPRLGRAIGASSTARKLGRGLAQRQVSSSSRPDRAVRRLSREPIGVCYLPSGGPTPSLRFRCRPRAAPGNPQHGPRPNNATASSRRSPRAAWPRCSAPRAPGSRASRRPSRSSASLPHLSEKKQFIGMFLDEARLSAHLSHSNCRAGLRHRRRRQHLLHRHGVRGRRRPEGASSSTASRRPAAARSKQPCLICAAHLRRPGLRARAARRERAAARTSCTATCRRPTCSSRATAR